MGRAGGWILGLVVVVGMAATAVLGLRPILFRKTLVFEYPNAETLSAEQMKAIQLAFAERNHRAGSFRVIPGFITGPLASRPRTNVLTLQFAGGTWTTSRPDGGQEALTLIPTTYHVGLQAARWARRLAVTRVFAIPQAYIGMTTADEFARGFRQEAGSLGLAFGAPSSNPQGKSLVDQVLEFRTELLILPPVEPSVLIDALRTTGYAGKVLIFTEWSKPGPGLEGTLFVSRYFPPPATALSTDYYAHLMTTLALEAIERAGTDDPKQIYKALAASPEFDEDGFSTLPGGLYVVRKGAVQFVEPLK